MYRTLANSLLVATGVLASHAIAYAIAAAGTSVTGHGYTNQLSAGTLPAVLSVLLVVSLRSARENAPFKALSLGSLAALQAVVFMTQESIETVVSGASFFSTFTQPVVLLGIAIQPLVALGLRKLVLVAKKVAALIHSKQQAHSASSALPLTRGYCSVFVAPKFHLRTNPLRGPPLLDL